MRPTRLSIISIIFFQHLFKHNPKNKKSQYVAQSLSKISIYHLQILVYAVIFSNQKKTHFLSNIIIKLFNYINKRMVYKILIIKSLRPGLILLF